MPNISKHQLINKIKNILKTEMSLAPENATNDQLYKALARVVRDMLGDRRSHFHAGTSAGGRKQVYYLSMEFLMGRSLRNSLFNLGLMETARLALREFDADLDELFEYEPDPGLGNGGLGRLAACYMDALTTMDYPAVGYCILYEFGIFKQQIVDGWQSEKPDNWLPGGSVWLDPVPEHTVEVRFGGEIEQRWDSGHNHIIHKNYNTVMAVPSNLYVSGYGTETVNLLRLWSAKSPLFDMDLFNKGDYLGAVGKSSVAEAISKILYPNDNHMEGRQLRLRQQYFLCCASITDIIRRHMSTYGTLDNFAEKNAIQINDTHPSLAIPELMRQLLDDFGYSWERSWDIVTRTFGYTNHTVMREALEVWQEDLMQTLLPRIYQIICEINRRFCLELEHRHHLTQYDIKRMSIVQDRQIKMAFLSIAGSHSVNGVSELHSSIIKEDLFRDFSRITPQKFKNVTNGIAARRWLCQGNPALTALCRELIGDGFLKDLQKLEGLKRFADNKDVLDALGAVKQKNKELFSAYLYKKTGEILNPDSIFDVQVKRLHEYKRQHMNALHILHLYLKLKENPNMDFMPRTFIFGAKAAPGYYLAKQIIKFICSLRDLIDSDPNTKDKLKIVFLQEYNVSLSEILMPAAEISEQISLAGTEASGTGNMKLMLGGALTLGTLDGANIEIISHAGRENNLIFGMTAQEAQQLASRGYSSMEYYENNPNIRAAVDYMTNTPEFGPFKEVASAMKNSDRYMALADFDSYCDIHRKAADLYKKQHDWQRMSLYNIAGAGYFCADRSIKEYAENIWKLK